MSSNADCVHGRQRSICAICAPAVDAEYARAHAAPSVSSSAPPPITDAQLFDWLEAEGHSLFTYGKGRWAVPDWPEDDSPRTAIQMAMADRDYCRAIKPDSMGDDFSVIRCGRGSGHHTPHRGFDAQSQAVYWDNEPVPPSSSAEPAPPTKPHEHLCVHMETPHAGNCTCACGAWREAGLPGWFYAGDPR